MSRICVALIFLLSVIPVSHADEKVNDWKHYPTIKGSLGKGPEQSVIDRFQKGDQYFTRIFWPTLEKKMPDQVFRRFLDGFIHDGHVVVLDRKTKDMQFFKIENHNTGLMDYGMVKIQKENKGWVIFLMIQPTQVEEKEFNKIRSMLIPD